MLEQAVRDLQRRDVDAALDDDVLLPPGDVDVAVGVPAGEAPVWKPSCGIGTSRPGPCQYADAIWRPLTTISPARVRGIRVAPAWIVSRINQPGGAPC
jgi:hypothetical protein